MSDRTECSYRGITILSNSYNILTSILLSRLSSEVDGIVGNHLGGFQRNRSNDDKIFWHWSDIREKWECSDTVHQLFIDFKTACGSVTMKVLYSFLTEFGMPMKLVFFFFNCIVGGGVQTGSTRHVGHLLAYCTCPG
jgi:hypothetical protein